jgi:hypothetical protein
MSYTTLASVKTWLWITWTNQDTILNQLISDANVYLNRALNITSFDTADITEKLRFFPQSYSQFGYHMFYLKNFNVTAIKEINWITYTWVLNTDYQIQNSRVLQIRNLHQYFVPVYFDYVTIKYTYWYVRSPDELPKDIELLERLLVQWLYNEKYPMGYSWSTNWQPNMQGISSYELWDEKISRKSTNKSTSTVSFKTENERNMFDQLFMKYKKSDNAIR